MVILDTNVVSELVRQHPEQSVMTWLDRQAEPSIWTTAINVFEIRGGLETLPPGRRRARLETEFARLMRRIFSTAWCHLTPLPRNKLPP
jgi:hypothetical protein